MKKKAAKTDLEFHYNSADSVLRAAQNGNLEAQHQIGAWYATGDWEGPKDVVQAVKWYQQAAESGHPLSQYDLGFMLILGEGAEKDVAKGLWWIEQAGRNGEQCAARLLSDIYEEGMFEVKPDSEKAQYWEKLSARFK